MMDGQFTTFAYVGSHTTPARAGKSKGINVYGIDEATGDWTLLQTCEEENPGWLAFGKNREYLYSGHASCNYTCAWHIDKASGKLEKLSKRFFGGSSTPHIEVDPQYKFLVVSIILTHKNGRITLLPIEEDGSLGYPCDTHDVFGELGPFRLKDSEKTLPHQTVFSPDGKYFYMPNRGLDAVCAYRIDYEAGKVVEVGTTLVRSGHTPRHLVFHPTLPVMYVISECAMEITAFRYDGRDGSLTAFQQLPTLPDTFMGRLNKGAEISVTPDGKTLYATNRGHNSLVSFAIDPDTGALRTLAWNNTYGVNPRFFTVDPSGRYIFVANEASSSVSTFLIEKETGLPQPTGQLIDTPSPTCLLLSGPVKNIAQRDVSQLSEVVSDFKTYPVHQAK